MENILAGIVGDVEVWEEEISKREIHIFVAIRIGCESDKMIERVAEESRNEKMLALRHQNYEMTGEESKKEEGFSVTEYVFTWSEWKRKVMRKG